MGCSHSTDRNPGIIDVVPDYSHRLPPRTGNQVSAIPSNPHAYLYPHSHSSSQEDISGQPRSQSSDEAPLERWPKIESSVLPTQVPGRPNRALRSLTPGKCPPKDKYPQHPYPWTRAVLEQERRAFWDTIAEYGVGRLMYWDTLRAVAELLRNPTQENMDQAQVVMNSAGLTCPTGKITTKPSTRKTGQGVYDDAGEQYEILDWHVVDPTDLVECATRDGLPAASQFRSPPQIISAPDEEAGSPTPDDDHAAAEDKRPDDDDQEESPIKDVSNDQANFRPTVKANSGKARARDLGEELNVRCRFNDASPDHLIRFREHERVTVLLGRIRSHLGLTALDKNVRVMYLGKILKEDMSLPEQGWEQGGTLSVHVNGQMYDVAS